MSLLSGPSWGKNARTSAGTAPNHRKWALLDDDNQPYIAHWCFQGSPWHTALYSHFHGSWHTESRGQDGGHPSIALDSQGSPHIAIRTWGDDLKYIQKSGSSWSAQILDYSSGPGTIALDSFDNPHLIYKTEEDGNTVIKDDGDWEYQDVFVTSSDIEWRALYFDLVDDNPTVAFSDGATVYYASLESPDGQPTISISDATVIEGQSGTIDALFSVTLSAARSQTVTVDYATADVDATAGVDYRTTTGTLSFAPGDVEGVIAVPVIGDTDDEPDETFLVTLFNPTNASMDVGQATGTIIDDEGDIYSPLVREVDEIVTWRGLEGVRDTPAKRLVALRKGTISYSFGPWRGEAADEEKQAIRDILTVREDTGFFEFEEQSPLLPAGSNHIHFQKWTSKEFLPVVVPGAGPFDGAAQWIVNQWNVHFVTNPGPGPQVALAAIQPSWDVGPATVIRGADYGTDDREFELLCAPGLGGDQGTRVGT